jgi:hypothetical protein
MAWGFRNGAEEAMRLAKRFAEAKGLDRLRCIDAQPYANPSGAVREAGILDWTVRFDGLPRGPYDDGSVLVLVHLETGEVRQLGRGGIT